MKSGSSKKHGAQGREPRSLQRLVLLHRVEHRECVGVIGRDEKPWRVLYEWRWVEVLATCDGMAWVRRTGGKYMPYTCEVSELKENRGMGITATDSGSTCHAKQQSDG